MTAVALEAPRRVFAEGCLSAPPGGERATLEERLQRAWRLLHADGAAECPVCGSELTLRGGAGECGGCGAQLG